MDLHHPEVALGELDQHERLGDSEREQLTDAGGSSRAPSRCEGRPLDPLDHDDDPSLLDRVEARGLSRQIRFEVDGAVAGVRPRGVSIVSWMTAATTRRPGGFEARVPDSTPVRDCKTSLWVRHVMLRHVDDSHGDRLSDPATLAEAQGWFNIVAGAWPLVSMRTFEAVFGPKEDRWLEYTVAGLLVTNGACQVMAARQGDITTAQRLGGGTALTLLAVDLVFVPAGRIRWTYLLDAVLEVGWLGLWAKARR